MKNLILGMLIGGLVVCIINIVWLEEMEFFERKCWSEIIEQKLPRYSKNYSVSSGPKGIWFGKTIEFQLKCAVKND